MDRHVARKEEIGITKIIKITTTTTIKFYCGHHKEDILI
jgi:hypothetical protein